MSQRNKAYANRMKRLKAKPRSKTNQFKSKKNMPECFNNITSFSCAETKAKCKAYQRIVYVLGLYNSFLSSFSETYYEKLKSSAFNSLSQPSSPIALTPASSYHSHTSDGPLTLKDSHSNTSNRSRGSASPFDIVTQSNLKPSKSPRKKKSKKKSQGSNSPKKKDRKSKLKKRKPAKQNGSVSPSTLKGGFHGLMVLKSKYNNINLVNDFNHCCEDHPMPELVSQTKDRLMNGNNMCHLHECISLHRVYRDRLRCCSDNAFRESLYLGFGQDQNETVTQQLMDRIHNHVLHTYDIGIQLDTHYGSESKQSDCDCDTAHDYEDGKLSKINEIISKKRDTLWQLTGTNRWFHKFTSAMDQNNDDNQGHYAPRYYYWPVYRDWEGSDKSNPGYHYSDWFVEAKHSSLKHELLHGHNRFLNKCQWQNLIALCNLYKHTNAIKLVKAEFADLHGYKIERYSPIQTQHLLSILVYCNFEAIRNTFRQTFVRTHAEEQDQHLKERHSVFVHLARLLRECVEIFGQRTIYSVNKTFYHCWDKELMLKETSGYFNMPTSTSIAYETVINLDTKGVILELADKNDTHLNGGLRFFDVSLISDTVSECECLFISSLSPLHIQTVIQCNFAHNYGYFIHSLNILWLFFKGKRYKNILNDGNDEWYKKCAFGLLQHQLSKNGKSEYAKDNTLPTYIDNLLHYFFSNTAAIQINFDHLLDSNQYKIFDQFFIESDSDNTYMNVSNLLLLFPNCVSITINAIKGRLQFGNDSVFENVLNLLSMRGRNVYLQEIIFKEAFPNTMCKLIPKYESKFIQARWLIIQQLSTLIFKQSTFELV